ncbi:MAG: hypothetical protein AB8F95_04745 [Bacteroidia bacterium]
MRNTIYLIAIFLLPIALQAQSAWLEPADATADDTVYLYVDLTQTDNEFLIVEAAASGEDMYIWTWKPMEHPLGHPLVNGLGDQAWKSSNPALKMTKESEGVYYYKMIPTEFYEVDANTVYAEDFHFLVKPQDGGGYGDPDIKTEDLAIKIDPANCDARKVGTFPDVVDANNTLPMTGSELMVLVYDNNMEEKATLQNNTDSLFVYARGTTENGVSVKVVSRSAIDETPALQMVNKGNGIYHWYIIPDELYKDVVPAGDRIKTLSLQILQKGARTSDQVVDGTFEYLLREE